MIISINGPAGSGKSTIAKRLAKKLNWPYYYIGGLRRARAKELGMTLAEYNKLGEEDPKTDMEVDEYQKELGEREDNFIIEGRTSWHFIPRSIKIYVDVDADEGAKRIYAHLKTENERNEDRGLKSSDDVLKSNRKRLKSDIKRYKKYYGIDVYDKSHYDHVIDTTDLDQEESFKRIWKFIEKQL